LSICIYREFALSDSDIIRVQKKYVPLLPTDTLYVSTPSVVGTVGQPEATGEAVIVGTGETVGVVVGSGDLVGVGEGLGLTVGVAGAVGL
jgi:hypothetical protein